MTNDEIRIAIAEECGWTIAIDTKWDNFVCAGKKDNDTWRNVPDYPNDLNAMHEVEKSAQTSNPNFKTFFVEELEKVVEPHLGNDFHRQLELSWACVNATARQHAEAFLRTKGKWRDA